MCCAPSGRLAILTSVRRAPVPARPLESALGVLTGMRLFGRDELVDALRRCGFEVSDQRIAGVTQVVAARRR